MYSFLCAIYWTYIVRAIHRNTTANQQISKSYLALEALFWRAVMGFASHATDGVSVRGKVVAFFFQPFFFLNPPHCAYTPYMHP